MSGKCNQKTMNAAGRHKSANTNALHQEENNAMHKRRDKVLYFTDPNEDKQRSSVVMVQAPVAAPVPAPATTLGLLMDQMFETMFKSMFKKKMAEMM